VTRGLSQLQRQILRLALDKGADVTLWRAELLAACFGFQPKPVRLYGSNDLTKPGQHFSPQQVGVARYRSAQVSLSRAVRRLEDRGLVAMWEGVYASRRGLQLTPAGVEAASETNG
jgi:hypothetical protein